MPEHSEALGLEVGKLGPGRYMIEGWDVDSAPGTRPKLTRWRARRFGEVMFAPTLREIKDMISDHRGGE